MKATVLATAAAMVGVSAAASHGHRHLHRGLFEKKDTEAVCTPGCTTIYSTITGEPTLLPPAPQTTSSSVISSAAPVPTSSGPILVPTPIPQTCPTPGTYTFPATTVVVTETTTVCGATVTSVPSGTHTLGGVTTVVETATTVVCPVATTETDSNGVVTSVIKTTTYVCPSAGTYTIAPITTTVPKATTVVVPVVETYCPGTYTAPAVVTTVTETSVVVYCPFTSSEAPAPTSAPAVTSAPAPSPSSPAKESSAPAPAPAPASSSSSSSSAPSSAPTGSLGGSGDLWAMTYTPFTPSGECKGASEVMSDVADIAKAGFTTLRVYSTDCDTLPNVGAAARAHGLRLIVGIFIGQVGCDNGNPNVAEQIAALKEWKAWDLVDLCVVGNEALFNGFCTVDQLTKLISHTKSELASVGFNGMFTTTDVVSAWLEKDVAPICSVIDVVATNAHAYFNADTKPEDAGKFVASQLKLVEKVCGKPGYVMETGWPNAGNCNGVACPGEAEQRTAIESIKNEIGPKVVFFSFKDDPWKQPGSCNCEQHWGCAKVFGA